MFAKAAGVELVCWLLVRGVDIEVNDMVRISSGTRCTAESSELLELGDSIYFKVSFVV